MLLLACTSFLDDLGRVVAIEVVGGTARQVEEGDTTSLEARALDAAGDVVDDADVVWAVLDVDSGQVGFTLAESGLISGVFPSSARVQGAVGRLRTGAITVTVSPAPDTVAPGSPERLTVPAGVPASDPMRVVVYDLTTEPGTQVALPGKPVHVVLVEPAAGSPGAADIFLVEGSVPVAPDPHRAFLTTGGGGGAEVTLHVVAGGTAPDSAVIDAVALTARGDTVSGSPVRFVVDFD